MFVKTMPVVIININESFYFLTDFRKEVLKLTCRQDFFPNLKLLTMEDHFHGLLTDQVFSQYPWYEVKKDKFILRIIQN